jgi:hypothetical protein
MNNRLLWLLASTIFVSSPTLGQRLELPELATLPIQEVHAEEISRYSAVEAGQGAAADNEFVYAIVNTAIGQYRKQDGLFMQRWASPRDGLARHINSCYAESGRLYCANSNFPEIPMASSIEVFDTETMSHIESYSLGMLEEGSLTWFERIPGGLMAGFAHYDEDGGLPYKNHNYASIIRYDSEWRRTGGWMIPETVMTRMQPHAASGGGLGPDGLLYLTGHDRPEMYVLAAPLMGPKLIHIATIAIDVEGQAFAWDKSIDSRIVYGISRKSREVRGFRLPEVTVPAEVLRFSELGDNPLNK